MTIASSFIPDPPPSEHAHAPHSAAHSNPGSGPGQALPGDEAVWAAARRSYVAGSSTPVVAERHGLNERTVRRRAAAEDWPGLRARARAALTPPPEAGEPPSAEAEIERLPMLGEFAGAHDYEVGQLLLNPEPERLIRFAFRRAAECAARGAPSEALAWMRLVQAADKTSARVERGRRPLAEADYLRASYAEQLREAWAGELDGEDGEEEAGEPEPGARRAGDQELAGELPLARSGGRAAVHGTRRSSPLPLEGGGVGGEGARRELG